MIDDACDIWIDDAEHSYFIHSALQIVFSICGAFANVCCAFQLLSGALGTSGAVFDLCRSVEHATLQCS